MAEITNSIYPIRSSKMAGFYSRSLEMVLGFSVQVSALVVPDTRHLNPDALDLPWDCWV